MATATATRRAAVATKAQPPARRGRQPSRRTKKQLALYTPSPADRMKREMIDEFGELNRQVQMFEPVQTRFELVKKAIKSWFDDAPADAEATVEGKVYLLHISARQRVRRIRDMQRLALEVGVDELLGMLASHVPLGVIEDMIGKTKTDALVVDERSGVRRIRAVPKCPSTPAVA